MLKLQTKVRARFSLQGVAVKNTDAFTQWHPEGKDMYARSEGQPVMSEAIEIWASEMALGAVHTE